MERVFASDFHAFVVGSNGTEIDIERVPDGRTLFKSTAAGTGCDNPKDPMTLGPVICSREN